MLPVLAVLAAALLFGTTGTVEALGPDDTTPLSVGAVRMVIGGTGLAHHRVRARRAGTRGARRRMPPSDRDSASARSP